MSLGFKQSLTKQSQTLFQMHTHLASLVPSSSRLVSLQSPPQIKYFSTTCKRKTHYQTLGVPETASKSQIKVVGTSPMVSAITNC